MLKIQGYLKPFGKLGSDISYLCDISKFLFDTSFLKGKINFKKARCPGAWKYPAWLISNITQNNFHIKKELQKQQLTVAKLQKGSPVSASVISALGPILFYSCLKEEPSSQDWAGLIGPLGTEKKERQKITAPRKVGLIRRQRCQVFPLWKDW